MAIAAIAEGRDSTTSLRDAYPELLDAWTASAEAAPEEIRPQLRQVSRNARAYWDAYAAVNFEAQKVPDIHANMAKEDLAAESDSLAVEAYFSEVCLIEMDA